MSDEHTIARYRRWYRKLLCCYSRPYRERFAESMEQTFNDLCRERAEAGRGLFGFVLWMCVETSAGIVGDNLRVLVMQRNIVRIAIGTGLILLVPLVAMQFTEEVNWGVFDFVAMGGLLFGTGLTYDVVARKGGTIAYRAAVGVACAAGLLLLWVNAAAGIIGDGPVNLMYLGVIAVGFVGVLLARFEPRGMAWALFATAVAQMLVPIIALAIWKSGENALFVDAGSPHPPFHPGIVPVFVLNGVFAALWLVSGLLFRCAAGTRSDAGRYERSHNALREGLAE